MNNSRNIIYAKNNFLDFFGFLSAKSHSRISPKMWFSGNLPEKVKFPKYIKSPIMVVWGWYMTHFDCRDILMYKKNRIGMIFLLVRPLGADLRNLGFFSLIFTMIVKFWKSSARTFDSEILFQKLIFTNFFEFSWN